MRRRKNWGGAPPMPLLICCGSEKIRCEEPDKNEQDKENKEIQKKKSML